MVVIDASDGAATENHSILGECASLVAEYILNLAQLFGDVHGTTLGAFVRVRIIQIDAVVNDEHLQQFAHLNRDVER